MSCPTPSTKSLGSSVHGIFPGKNTGLGCRFLLQRIFPTQGWNPCLLHWQTDSLPLSHLGTPKCLYQEKNHDFCVRNDFVWEISLQIFSKCLWFFKKIKIQLKSNTASSASLLNLFPLLMTEYPLSIIQRKGISFIHILSKDLVFFPL